jgi:hypothetical protein
MPVSQYRNFCSGTVEEIRLGFNFVCLGGSGGRVHKILRRNEGAPLPFVGNPCTWGGVTWMSMKYLLARDGLATMIRWGL